MAAINISILEIVSVVVFWLIVLFQWTRQSHNTLPTVSAALNYKLEDVPLVSIIVPARNEEDCIEYCVRSLLAQDYPRFEIIAVDDRSDDATGSILDGLAETEERLRVVHGSRLPENWSGKTHAITQGYKVANGEWLLFTDADTEHAPCLLSGAMAHVLEHRVAYATVLGELRYPTTGTYLVSIAVAAFIFLLFDAKSFMNQASRLSLLNGHFVLFSRDAYEAIGTHASIRRYSSTDVTLGYLAKLRGWTSLLIDGQSVLKTTMYRTFSDAFSGWSRVLVNGAWSALGNLFGSLLLILSAVVLCLFWIAPWIGFWWNLFNDNSWSLGANSLQILAGLAVIQLGKPGWRKSISHTLVMPFSVALFTTMICVALPVAWIRGGTRWKGRIVRTTMQLPRWRPRSRRTRYPGTKL